MRDVAVFQAKLLVDGLRDLVLSPVSLVAGLVGLITDRKDPGRHFRRVLEFGAASEIWINLFGRHTREDVGDDLDELFSRLEKRVIDQYEKGGITAQAKTAIDRSLDAIHNRIEPPLSPGEPPDDVPPGH